MLFHVRGTCPREFETLHRPHDQTGDLDIYRSANLLVKQHGEDAPIEDAMRADTMLERADLDGYDVWKRILWAVGELQGVEPGPGAWVH